MTYLPKCVTCGALSFTSCGACDLPICPNACAISHALDAHSYGVIAAATFSTPSRPETAADNRRAHGDGDWHCGWADARGGLFEQFSLGPLVQRLQCYTSFRNYGKGVCKLGVYFVKGPRPIPFAIRCRTPRY